MSFDQASFWCVPPFLVSIFFPPLMLAIPCARQPDIFDNDEVEIEISSTPPPLLATSPMQRQVGTRKGVVSVGHHNLHLREDADIAR